MNYFHRFRTAAVLLLLIGWVSCPGFAQGTYPKPVSEYAEEISPGTMVFLSYPKYYKNAEGQLTKVKTSLVTSGDPAWDFEVSEGIWQLKVKKDGTFQAEHEGDIFTYRFNSLGVGRGSNYRPFELGKADFSRFIITGDTIRWSDVYPDIDLSVRYIHDILKVDVVVKNAFMQDLKAETKEGKLDKNDYLTARFDIPQVLISSKAKQNGQDKDLYAEALDVEQPVYFEKDGKVVHKLRPVETFLLRKDGEGDYTMPIRSAQTWQLKRDERGIAEMSSLIEDLVKLPEGDVIIDPSLVIEGVSAKDALLDYENPTLNYSSGTYFYLGRRDRLIMGFDADADTSAMLKGRNIISATLSIDIYYNDSGNNINYRAVKVGEDWVLNEAGYNNRKNATTWAEAGGSLEKLPSPRGYKYVSKPVTIKPYSQGEGVFDFDVTQILKSHMVQGDASQVLNRGFIIKRESEAGSDTNQLKIYNSHCKLYVNYEPTEFGNDVGAHSLPSQYPYGNRISMPDRMQHLKDDGQRIIRYFAGDEVDYGDMVNGQWVVFKPYLDMIDEFVAEASNKGLKVIMVFPGRPSMTAANYASDIVSRLNRVSDEIADHTIMAIEIGNEEEGRWGTSHFGTESDGRTFADHYLAALIAIKNQTWWRKDLEIISGGSIQCDESLGWSAATSGSDSQGRPYGSAGDFVTGFIKKCQEYNNNYTNDYLPDTIAIHSYSGSYNPEEKYDDWGGQPKTQYGKRMNLLFNRCDVEGYLPNFSITEFGYCPSATIDPGYAPVTGASEESQAVYYLRSCLMKATMKGSQDLTPGQSQYHTPLKGIGWKNDIYFAHPKPDSRGFYNNDGTEFSYGSLRDIKYIAPHLFDFSIITGDATGLLNRPAIKVLTPFIVIKETGTNNNYLAYCAFHSGVTPTDVNVAVWRFVEGADYPNLASASRSVEVDVPYLDEYPIKYVEQFNFSSGTPILEDRSNQYTVTVETVDPGWPNPPTKSRITVTDNNTSDSYQAIDENPIMIHFSYPVQ